MTNDSNSSSDEDTCSTISFRNEDIAMEFMLSEDVEKSDDLEGSVVKIDAYSSAEDDKRSEIGIDDAEEEYSDKECRYLAQMSDPRFMTARQRSLLDKRSGVREMNAEEMIDPLPISGKESRTPRQLCKTGDHRRAVKERQQEEQRVTVEKLLKVTPASRLNKRARQVPSQENESQRLGPSIRILSTQRVGCASFVAFSDADLCPSWNKTDGPPQPVLCAAEGCNNRKRYCCALTGKPLCHRIECYRSVRNHAMLVPMIPLGC